MYGRMEGEVTVEDDFVVPGSPDADATASDSAPFEAASPLSPNDGESSVGGGARTQGTPPSLFSSPLSTQVCVCVCGLSVCMCMAITPPTAASRRPLQA